MNAPTETAPEKNLADRPGYAYNFQADLGSGRLLSIGGNFRLGATLEEMNKEIDQVRKVIDRQQAKSAVPAIEAEISRNEITLNALVSDLAAVDKRNEGVALKTVDATHRANVETSIRNLEARIAEQRKQLERTQKEAE